MSGQIGSNSEDDVDFLPSTNVEEIQSVSNTLDENQNTGRKRTSRAWDHFTRQEIDGKIKAVCNHCGPKRHEKFEDTARQLGIPYTKKISLDCVTRWNSTFLMLSTALSYKTVFERARLRELRLRCAPSEIDWQNAQQLCDKLEVFHEVTELFSGTKYPTANIFFPKICEIKTNIDSWMSSDVPFIKDMATQMMSKFQKYWKEIHGLMCVAVVLDPRYKFMLLEYYFPVIYGDEQHVTQIANIRELCCELLEEYGSKFPDLRERRVQVDNVSSSSTRRMDALSNFDRYVRASYRVENMKSELDLYLEENLVPRTEESFDICNYWKVTGLKYPLLSMIAKDVFAVPVSTVASESSFSTGGRHVSPHRSRLHPSTLEALVCTQNWLMTDKKVTINDEDVDVDPTMEPYVVDLDD